MVHCNATNYKRVKASGDISGTKVVLLFEKSVLISNAIGFPSLLRYNSNNLNCYSILEDSTEQCKDDC